MKKLLLIFLLFFAAKSFAQYPAIQNLGNDSTLIRVGQNYKGGIKGGLINMSVADTTAANLLRIKAYPGAQIYTDDGSVWIRNITATGWVLMGGGSVSPSGRFWAIGGNLFPVTAPTRDIGTLAPYGGAVGFITNSVTRAIIPDAGFTLSNDTTNTKVFTWNPTSKEWGYANWNNGGSGGGGGSPAGNYGNFQINRNGAFATPGSDSADFDGGLSIKGTIKVTSLGSGANTDSAVTYNTSTNFFNKKALTVIDIASRDSGDVIQWNGTTNVYVPLPTGANNLIGTVRFQTDVTANAPSTNDSTLTNTNFVNKYLFVYREGFRQDSSATDGYTFSRSTGVVTFHPPLDSLERVQIDVYDTLSVYRIALETIVQPSVDLNFAANRSNLTQTGTVFTPTSYIGSFDAYGQDALILPSGVSGRVYSQYVTSGNNTYMLFFNTSSTFLPYTNSGSNGFYINGTNGIQPLNSGTTASSVGTASAPNYYGWYRDVGAGTIKIQSSSDAITWTDLYTLPYYISADLYISLVIYSGGGSGPKISNPKGQGVQ